MASSLLESVERVREVRATSPVEGDIVELFEGVVSMVVMVVSVLSVVVQVAAVGGKHVVIFLMGVDVTAELIEVGDGAVESVTGMVEIVGG